MLQDAFRNAIKINKEISFVDATTGRSGETRLTQINEIDDSFPDYEINAMSTRSTDRSGNKSFDRSFDRSSSRSGSQNSSFNSRPSFRNSNGSFNSSNSNTQGRQSWGQKPTHKGIHFSKEIVHLKTDSKDSKATDTTVITGSNRGVSQPNLTTADQHQKHR